MELLLQLPILLFSIVVHEYAHGRVALAQGDDTAAKLGRLTLNPLPHIDLMGSILVPAVLWFTGAGFLFGWAKPVPVDPRKFREYRKGDILVSLAGVASNIVLTVVFILLMIALIYIGRFIGGTAPAVDLLIGMARFGILINLILAFFNLIPIPPLDGSHVVYHLLPAELGARYRALGRYGILILVGIMFLAPSLIGIVLWPVRMLNGLAETFVMLWT